MCLLFTACSKSGPTYHVAIENSGREQLRIIPRAIEGRAYLHLAKFSQHYVDYINATRLHISEREALNVCMCISRLPRSIFPPNGMERERECVSCEGGRGGRG